MAKEVDVKEKNVKYMVIFFGIQNMVGINDFKGVLIVCVRMRERETRLSFFFVWGYYGHLGE